MEPGRRHDGVDDHLDLPEAVHDVVLGVADEIAARTAGASSSRMLCPAVFDAQVAKVDQFTFGPPIVSPRRAEGRGSAA